jgi:hypothetical protein
LIEVYDAYSLPSPVVSDSFNRVDAALGNSDGLGHAEANGGAGYAWTAQTGTWGVATNVAAASILAGDGYAIATVDSGLTDVLIETIVTYGLTDGVVLRYVDADNYIAVRKSATALDIITHIDGTEAVVATVANAGAVNQILHVVMSGTAVKASWNYFPVLTATIADAILQTSTRHGLLSSHVGATFDNFVVWPRRSGLYSQLASFF